MFEIYKWILYQHEHFILKKRKIDYELYDKENLLNLLEKQFEKDSIIQAIAFSFVVKKIGFVGKSMPKSNETRLGRDFLSSATNPLSIR